MISRTIVTKRLKKIKMVINDVDGVLTDGGVYLDNNGIESKRFSVLDGAGCALADMVGLKTAWVTARKSKLVALRAKECKVTWVLQGQKRKLPALEQLLKKSGCTAEEVVYIGDDIVDIPVMKKVGLAVAVPNASEDTLQAAHYITKRSGGEGAVREIIELILRAQGLWQKTVAAYQGKHEEKN